MIIFDLDGTLANIDHRRPLVDKLRRGGPQWMAFFEACVHDEPIWPVIRLYRALKKAGVVIEIWSGRSESVRPQTEDWLERFVFGDWRNGLRSTLRMRSERDNTPDAELKEFWLEQALARGEVIDLVIDDRQRVVDMWRRRGITCLQCAEGNY